MPLEDLDVLRRRDPRTDPRAVPRALQENGLLPYPSDRQPRAAEPLRDAFAAPVRSLDPQRPHADGAGMYASFPSGLHPEFDPPELLIWGTGNNYAYLILYFSGLEVVQHMAAIDMEVWVNNSATIAATNAAGLTVSSGSTSTRVTFQIPFTPTADGLAVVSLTPGSTDQGFSWYGTSVAPA